MARGTLGRLGAVVFMVANPDGAGTLRATVLGATMSGKSRFIWNRWVSKLPRVIVVDHTGEWRRSDIEAEYTIGYRETVAALRAFAGCESFRIIADLSENEIAALSLLLVPERDIFARSPSFAMGGMALYLPEVDQSIELNSRASLVTKTLWRRGRHALLSVFADTQSLSSCSKEVTKNAEILALLNFDEPRDMDYIRAKIGSPAEVERALAWASKPYHVAVWLARVRKLVLLPPGNPELAP